ncbi:hypothetical protein EVAR_94358_1 [Eumeta japonica]|uniref:Uncharacterized protein n=1 Tax=Eumeta variegata TaxID=151549 RepID=A0A4C1TPW1_EUMVA|nr:hypothetical protein EVAR_94358_1 [Eumeta japonica]
MRARRLNAAPDWQIIRERLEAGSESDTSSSCDTVKKFEEITRRFRKSIKNDSGGRSRAACDALKSLDFIVMQMPRLSSKTELACRFLSPRAQASDLHRMVNHKKVHTDASKYVPFRFPIFTSLPPAGKNWSEKENRQSKQKSARNTTNINSHSVGERGGRGGRPSGRSDSASRLGAPPTRHGASRCTTIARARRGRSATGPAPAAGGRRVRHTCSPKLSEKVGRARNFRPFAGDFIRTIPAAESRGSVRSPSAAP